MKILLVYNPTAGNGKANKLLPKIKHELNERKIFFEILTTSCPGHAVDLVKDADLSGYDGIVSAGGDGTMFESLNGYYLNPGK
ncbi:MAG: acylglycerol kinase family protein, partial [Candidatus Aminicenantes bacterium]|nr:acylglycerol kinase family protein [Candidatus Aminicenantes bacterium]